ncbi:unnamed protein product [Lathyrus sativus]|nr:unnamed protein product [Lathyrus sativus]
MDHHYMCS